jgi:hypothetical protein
MTDLGNALRFHRMQSTPGSSRREGGCSQRGGSRLRADLLRVAPATGESCGRLRLWIRPEQDAFPRPVRPVGPGGSYLTLRSRPSGPGGSIRPDRYDPEPTPPTHAPRPTPSGKGSDAAADVTPQKINSSERIPPNKSNTHGASDHAHPEMRCRNIEHTTSSRRRPPGRAAPRHPTQPTHTNHRSRHPHRQHISRGDSLT